jgi:hypothetical protein
LIMIISNHLLTWEPILGDERSRLPSGFWRFVFLLVF